MEPETQKKDDINLNIDKDKLIGFIKKYNIFLLLIIPIFFAVFFRAYTYDLPITDSFAQGTIEQNIKNQVQSQILAQTSDIDQNTLNTLVQQKYQEYINSNIDLMEQQQKQVSQQIKEFYKDDSGQTYLLAIDPYHYYRQAQNVLENGHVGDELREGKPFDNHMMAPKGKFTENDFHSFMGGQFHKISMWFGNDSLMSTMFILPLLFAALSVIPTFFIGRKMGGNLGGLVAAFIVAIHPTFLGRTPAGFSDTDAYTIFFPLMIIWLFLESFTTPKYKNKIIFGSLAGLFTGIFTFTWGGWWYIFDIILGSLVVYFLYLLIKYRKSVFKKLKTKNLFKVAITYIVSSSIFITIFSSFNDFISAFRGPISILFLKEAAKKTLWPNVYTTVAELNEVSFIQVISSLGGKLFFALAIIGLILIFLKKKKMQLDIKYGILMILWFIGVLYTTTKGIRFVMYVIPIFAIGIGIFYGRIYHLITNWGSRELDLNKKLLSISLIVLAVISFIPLTKAANDTALREMPSMNDAWYTALTNIKEDSSENAIISSWWDFGHWFKAIADRKVTFDGASQNRPQAHWVGKILLTDNEDEAIAILRMLNCGANDAYDFMLEETQDAILTKSLIDQIILEDENTARITLSKYVSDPDKILEKTHCNPPEDYFITSEDMVSKAGVWAHFGSWNFERAFAYNTIKSNQKDKAITILKEKLGYSDEEATSTYRQLKGVSEGEANSWIAPYPSYSSTGQCQDQNGTLYCTNGIIIDLNENIAIAQTDRGQIFMNYRDNDQTYIHENASEEISVAYIPETSQVILAHPILLNSIFTELFFYNGRNLKHFELFDHQQGMGGFDIYTWKVQE
jgi:dolichyl-phosphooligosaccharide-protein glycotransferase